MSKLVPNSDDGEDEDALLEVSQGLLLEDHLDLATSGDINGFDGILAVSEDKIESEP